MTEDQARFDACVRTGNNQMRSTSAAFKEGWEEARQFSAEENAKFLKALKEARGTLGYGPLDTLPETIARVREILDTAIRTS